MDCIVKVRTCSFSATQVSCTWSFSSGASWLIVQVNYMYVCEPQWLYTWIWNKLQILCHREKQSDKITHVFTSVYSCWIFVSRGVSARVRRHDNSPRHDNSRCVSSTPIVCDKVHKLFDCSVLMATAVCCPALVILLWTLMMSTGKWWTGYESTLNYFYSCNLHVMSKCQ